MTCYAGRLFRTDGRLVRFAVNELHLEIIGRKRWGTQCPGCKRVVKMTEWRRHRC